MAKHSIKSPKCKLITFSKHITHCHQAGNPLPSGMVRRPAKPSVFAADCSSRDNLCVLGNKWSLLVLRALGGQKLRFTDLHQRVGGISQKMLAQTLRNLGAKGLVLRRVYPEIPVRIVYSLTKRSQPLARPINAICQWAESESTNRR
jgi:DNA-binding HxlR family transcriptional regulator